MEKIHTSNIPAIVYPMDIGVIGKFSIVALMEMFLEDYFLRRYLCDGFLNVMNLKL